MQNKHHFFILVYQLAEMGKASEAEVDVGECQRDNVTRFCEIYTLPPKSVRSSISKLGRGFFVEIDEDTANFVYEFENGELYEF